MGRNSDPTILDGARFLLDRCDSVSDAVCSIVLSGTHNRPYRCHSLQLRSGCDGSSIIDGGIIAGSQREHGLVGPKRHGNIVVSRDWTCDNLGVCAVGV